MILGTRRRAAAAPGVRLRRGVLATGAALLAALAMVQAATPPPAVGSAPQLVVQQGHTGAISAFARTGEGGRLMATLSPGSGLKLWDPTQGRLLRTLETGADARLAASPDGRQLATGGDGQAVRLWDVVSGRLLRTLEPRGGALALAWSARGTHLAATDAQGQVHVHDLRSPQAPAVVVPVAAPSEANGVWLRTLSFVADDRELVVGVERTVFQSLAVVDLQTQQVARRIRLGREALRAVAASPDGARAVVSVDGGPVEIWNLRSAQKEGEIGPSQQARALLAYEARGQTLLLARREGRDALLEWRSSDGQRVLRSVRAQGVDPTGVWLAPEGRQAWVADGSVLRRVDLDPVRVSALGASPLHVVNSLAFDSTGNRLALASHGRLAVLDFDRPGRSPRVSFSAGPDWITRVAFQGEGAALALVMGHGSGLWSAGDAAWRAELRFEGLARQRSTRIMDIPGASPSLERLRTAFDARAQWMVAATRAPKMQLRAMREGANPVDLLVPQASPETLVTAPALSGDGRVAGALVSDEALAIWEVPGGQLRQLSQVEGRCPGGASRLSPLAGESLALNTDGSLAAFHICGQLSVFDVRAQRVLRTVAGGSAPRFLGSSPSLVVSGRREVAGRPQAYVSRWDPERESPAWEQLLPPGLALQDWALSPDGQTLAGAMSDRVVRLYNTAQGREVISIALVGDGWVVMTPDGWFDASSPGAEQALLVRHGPELFDVLPVASFRERFYRPDAIREVLAGRGTLVPQGLAAGPQAPSAPALVTAARPNLPPDLRLTPPPGTSGNGAVHLQLSLLDRGSGIGDLRVYVNGTAVATQTGGRNLTVGAAAMQRTVPIRLAPGTQEISVIAFDASNTVSSEPVRATVQVAGSTDRKPQLHAVVVGIDRFQNPALDLRYAVADAQAIAETLRRQTGGLFERVNLQLLTRPEQTTKSALVDTLARLREVAPEDVFVLFVASHGTVIGDDLSSKAYFLITSNVGSVSTRALQRDAISQQELKALIGNIPAGKKALFFDTCHSGAVGAAIQGGARGLAEDSAIKVLSNAVGSTVLSASTSQQESLEGYENHGVFTWVLLQALSGKADVRRRGYVTTLDLANYVEDEVPRIAEQVFKARQFPNLHTAGQAFPLVLSNRPN